VKNYTEYWVAAVKKTIPQCDTTLSTTTTTNAAEQLAINGLLLLLLLLPAMKLVV